MEVNYKEEAIMLKILICCGGGFSSSAMVTKVKKEIVEKHLEDKVMIDFYPFTLANEIMSKYDVLMACPHLRYGVPQFIKAYEKECIPIYLLPPKMYGTMNLEDIMEDAEDIIAGFKETKMNPFHFPGEDNVLKVRRIHSYRREHQ